VRYEDFIGAIVFTKGKNLISDVISWGQELEGIEARFIPSHVAIVSSYLPDYEKARIWEATIGGVQKNRLSKYVNSKHITYIAYMPGLTLQQKMAILNWAERFKGKQYGYLDLMVYFFDLLGTKIGLKRGWLTRRLNTSRFLVCSEFVGYVYGRSIHYRFRDDQGNWIKPSSLTPLDIWRHVRREKWEIINISQTEGNTR